MFKTIGVSLIITILVSLGIGFVVKDILGFWEGVVGSVIIQFLIFYYLTSSENKSDKQPEPDIVEEIINLQTVPITCPCGKHTFTTPVFYNADNSFSCEKCGSKFKVELSYETVLLTEPLNIENVFNQLKERELSDNKV